MSVKRNQYGREIKKGIVFGYLCFGREGHAHDNKVYRFGKTTKTEIDLDTDMEERTKVHIERLGAAFGGLNKAEHVILFEEVADVYKAWDIVREYLRNHNFISTSTERPISCK